MKKTLTITEEQLNQLTRIVQNLIEGYNNSDALKYSTVSDLRDIVEDLLKQ